MSQAGKFLQKVLFPEVNYSSYLLIIRDGYLTGHLFCSLLRGAASPPALSVNCGMLLDIKPHETLDHCQLFTRVNKSISLKLEQFIIVLCSWGSLFTQVELFLAKEQIFPQLVLDSSGKILSVRLMPFFSSQWQTRVLFISVFYRNSFRSSRYECSWGEGGGKHIFYSSVSVQFCVSSLAFHLTFAASYSFSVWQPSASDLLNKVRPYKREKKLLCTAAL